MSPRRQTASKISLMQGRLLPPFKNRFQAFPAMGWEKEFEKAKQLGLYSIEWIYEKPYEEKNPLINDFEINHLKKIINDTGIHVKSICADYYMTEHLIQKGAPFEKHWGHLAWLCQQARLLDIRYIILPFVDASSLQTKEDCSVLIKSLQNFFHHNQHAGIEIHLESDLHPKDFKNVLEGVNHPMLKMNYDVGNSASLGYDPDEEFELLGSYLGSVHIKDRVLSGKTVPLGTGDAKFDVCFGWFEKLNFDGWYVLQAARGQIDKEMETVSSQISFVEQYLSKKNIKNHGS
ncbi:MAG: sugar phosphate isomerase/epimerase [Alphaproteobacteria bacterium]|nr:sugar phosphate isomerase/epimerase [Alphaproteobacteria bacterium]